MSEVSLENLFHRADNSNDPVGQGSADVGTQTSIIFEKAAVSSSALRYCFSRLLQSFVSCLCKRRDVSSILVNFHTDFAKF